MSTNHVVSHKWARVSSLRTREAGNGPPFRDPARTGLLDNEACCKKGPGPPKSLPVLWGGGVPPNFMCGPRTLQHFHLGAQRKIRGHRGLKCPQRDVAACTEV